MTTTNTLGQTVFSNGVTLPQILAYGMKQGITAMEQAIIATYTKSDASYIINVINQLK